MRPCMVELKGHPFISKLNNGAEMEAVRRSIVEELQLLKALPPLRREPEVTAKHGKLKSDRNLGFETILVDDLASLSTLDELTNWNLIYQGFIPPLQHQSPAHFSFYLTQGSDFGTIA